ncbi:MAG TPA: hypothetical protein PLV92_10210, partial [Pirellulaceae bacterium]|nr:hypothetical protein [Pirellulaceae bacterium]
MSLGNSTALAKSQRVTIKPLASRDATVAMIVAMIVVKARHREMTPCSTRSPLNTPMYEIRMITISFQCNREPCPSGYTSGR